MIAYTNYHKRNVFSWARIVDRLVCNILLIWKINIYGEYINMENNHIYILVILHYNKTIRLVAFVHQIVRFIRKFYKAIFVTRLTAYKVTSTVTKMCNWLFACSCYIWFCFDWLSEWKLKLPFFHIQYGPLNSVQNWEFIWISTFAYADHSHR